MSTEADITFQDVQIREIGHPGEFATISGTIDVTYSASGAASFTGTLTATVDGTQHTLNPLYLLNLGSSYLVLCL